MSNMFVFQSVEKTECFSISMYVFGDIVVALSEVDAVIAVAVPGE